jgi:hypothetical protein
MAATWLKKLSPQVGESSSSDGEEAGGGPPRKGTWHGTVGYDDGSAFWGQVGLPKVLSDATRGKTRSAVTRAPRQVVDGKELFGQLVDRSGKKGKCVT